MVFVQLLLNCATRFKVIKSSRPCVVSPVARFILIAGIIYNNIRSESNGTTNKYLGTIEFIVKGYSKNSIYFSPI